MHGFGSRRRRALVLGLPFILVLGTPVTGSVPGAAPTLQWVLETQGETQRLGDFWQADTSRAVDAATLRARVRSANRLGHFDAAIALLDASPSGVDSGTVAFVRAGLEARRGHPEACLDRLASTRPPAGLELWARLLAAESEGELGRWEAARDAAVVPNDAPLPPEVMQRLLLVRARGAQAAHDLVALRRMAPELGDASRRDDRTGLLLLGLARETARGGELLQARDWWLDLLDSRPTPAESAYVELEHRPALVTAPDVVLRIARFEMRSGRHAAARLRLRTAILSGLPAPERATARLLIAESFLRSGDAAECLKACQRAARSTDGTPAEPERLRLEARALKRIGRVGEALSTYNHLAARFPRHDKADDALYEVGWILENQHRLRDAERAYLRVTRAYPNGSLADDARLRAGLCALRDHRPAEAAEHLAHVVARNSRSALIDNALYWQMLAQIQMGDASGALVLRDRLQRDFPRSYFTVLARNRIEQGLVPPLGRGPENVTQALAPAGGVGLERAERVTAAYDSAITTLRTTLGLHAPEGFDSDARAWRLLLDWGFDSEASWETRRLERRWDGDSGALLELIANCHAHGAHERLVRQAYVLGQKITDPRVRDALEVLLYPAPYTQSLAAAAERHGLSHAIMLGLMRQESAFDPRIDSAVGARGLMQLMPEVGRRLAAQAGDGDFHADRLYEPQTNIELGSALFAAELQRAAGDVPQALAAYNAGADVAALWATRLGKGDGREMYLELAEYAETRTYLETVLGNAETYRRLYALP
jgi:tetratricopeptide (TPR) repeat protein